MRLYLCQRIPAVCRPPEHQECSTGHRTQCPKFHPYRFLHVLHRMSFHRPVWYHHPRSLWRMIAQQHQYTTLEIAVVISTSRFECPSKKLQSCFRSCAIQAFVNSITTCKHIQILTFCTSKSSIIQVTSTEIKISNPIMLAVYKSCFSAIADQVIQEDGARSLTKEGIVQWRGTCGISNKIMC